MRAACDVLAPVYMRSGGEDGFVSIEVSPAYAYDPAKTIAEAERLFAAVDRPNAMIKIPGTREGVPAILESLRNGLNINITLLFSLSQYEAVAEAYLDALEYRLQHDLTIRAVSSVASFFVSRVDTLVDELLDAQMEDAPTAPTGAGSDALKGRAGVANSKIVYERFRTLPQQPPVAAHRRVGRQGAAHPLGEHRHEGSRLLGRPVRRRAHRRAHDQHAAPRRPGRRSRITARSSARWTATSRRRTARCGS